MFIFRLLYTVPSLALRTSRYYGHSLLQNHGHFRGYPENNFIVSTFDKAGTRNFSYNIITKNCRLLLTFCQNTHQKTSGIQARRVDSVEGGSFNFLEFFFSARGANTSAKGASL